MKKLITFLLIIFTASTARAQFVSIPDAAFVTYLQNYYPAAMTGNQMDTTHSSITSATSLTIVGSSTYSMSNAYGVQFFDNITQLTINNTQITSLPALHANIALFNCNKNSLTTLPALPNSIIHLYAHSNNLSSLPTMPSGLLKINVSDNNLTTLPALPNSVTEIKCYNNQLTALPTLPSNLFQIYCYSNQISVLPALPNGINAVEINNNQLTALPSLPASLKFIKCNINQITSIPTLPNGLEVLECANNPIGSLPILTPSIEFLNIGSCQLTNIPAFPSSIEYLFCKSNQLSVLPTLPAALISLECDYNPIAVLPTLPSNLKYLRARACQLTTLPNIPASLELIFCDSNQIATIPSFTNSALQQLIVNSNNLTSLSPFPTTLKSIQCMNNPNLTCLPYFSQDSFTYFYVRANTGITCLPRTVAAYASIDNSTQLPLCTPTSGCTIAYNITGNVHEDSSANCQLDSLNNGAMLGNVKLQQLINGTLSTQMYSNGNGQYSFDANVGDSVNVLLDPGNANFLQISCPTNGMRIANLTSVDSIFTNQDFGIKCSGADLVAHSIYGTFRNTQTRSVQIAAGDLSQEYGLDCASGMGGTVTTTITGPVSYSAPMIGALTPTTAIGNVLTYNITDFAAVDYKSAFNILVTTDSFAALNSPVCITVNVNSTAPDLDVTNDTLTFCGVTTNSYDPNDKSAFPIENTTPDSWITYNIRFQNTGNDTAYHVIIRDTLSNYLDEGTFTYLNGSVRPQIILTGKKIMFNYPNINLVDSNTNEPASHGWVQYRVKTVSNLPLNTKVENTASIYFDSNPPIVTNTTSNEYVLINTSTKNIVGNVGLQLFPNPTSGVLNISTTKAGVLQIVSLLGKEVYNKEITQTNTPVNLQLPRLASGVYIYQYRTANGDKNKGKLLIK